MQTQPKVEDALSYLEQVKKRYINNPTAYTEFLDIMKDFKGDKLNTSGVIEAVKKLFHGQRDLILGFNFFLPPDIKIPQESEPGQSEQTDLANPSQTSDLISPDELEGLETMNQPTYQDAQGYVAAVREATTQEQYKEFLDILNSSQSQTTADNQSNMLERIENLFEGHDKLIQGFKDFLPNTQSPVSATKNLTNSPVSESNLTDPAPSSEILPPPYNDDYQTVTMSTAKNKEAPAKIQEHAINLGKNDTNVKAVEELKTETKDNNIKEPSDEKSLKKAEKAEKRKLDMVNENSDLPALEKADVLQEPIEQAAGMLCIIRLEASEEDWPWCVGELRKKHPKKKKSWTVWWYGNPKSQLLGPHLPWWRNSRNKGIYAPRDTKKKGLTRMVDQLETQSMVWWGFKLTDKNKVPDDVLDIISRNPKVQWTRGSAKKKTKKSSKKRKKSSKA